MLAALRIFSLAMLIVTSIASSGSTAADLEVDNVRGNDFMELIPGDPRRPPYRSIQRAVDDALTGDTIRILKTDRPYRECVSINSRHDLGTPEFPLIIEGNGVILDGSQPLGVLDWDALGSDLFELKVRSPGFVRLLAAADQPTPENLGHLRDLSTLQPFQYARNTGNVYFRTRPGDVPQAYGISVSKEQTGLTLYDVSDIVIRNLTVTGYRLDGVNCHDLVTNVKLENVVATNNGRSGVSIGGSSRVAIQGGSLSGNGQAQLRAEGQSIAEAIGIRIDAGKSTAIDQAGGRVIVSR